MDPRTRRGSTYLVKAVGKLGSTIESIGIALDEFLNNSSDNTVENQPLATAAWTRAGARRSSST